MMGRLMAQCDESAGETVIQGGMKVKCYRGMGAKANKNSQCVRTRFVLVLSSQLFIYLTAIRYGVTETIFVPQGVEGRVPQTGSVHDIIPKLGLQIEIFSQNNKKS